jgi:hypothetical protein
VTAELYTQLTNATTQASKALELVAHLALTSGKGLEFSDRIREIADQLEEAQGAVDDYYGGD